MERHIEVPPGIGLWVAERPATTPVLVIEAPEDPINPPPHAAHLASRIARSKLVTLPGMGHALPGVVIPATADVILGHTTGR